MTGAQQNIVTAFNRGYRVDEKGDVYFKGRKRALNVGTKGYLRFTICNDAKQFCSIHVHQLQAFQKFGEAMFAPGIEVRHLNNTCSDNSDINISLGSRSENEADKSVETKARAQKRATDAVRKWDRPTIQKFKETHTYKETMEHFGISSKGTLHFVLNGGQVGRGMEKMVNLPG